MSEHDAVEDAARPVTVDSLATDLRELGVDRGDTVLVHTSLNALGWVCVDAQTVVDALLRVITPEGTVVMPTHSGQYGDPAAWSNPPVPDEWVETIRTERPPYRPETTPTRGVGVVPECFRSYPGVRRSRHPVVSFAAWGHHADTVIEGHSYDDGLGDGSPLARVYDLNGDVLLLGVGHAPNTSLHLAEYRADSNPQRTTNLAPVIEDGERALLEYSDIETDDSDFVTLGEAFEAEQPDALETGPVGGGSGRRCSQRALVDFATGWLEDHR